MLVICCKTNAEQQNAEQQNAGQQNAGQQNYVLSPCKLTKKLLLESILSEVESAIRFVL
jgi:hypothetical protein